MHKKVIASKNAAAPDYSDITFWWRCEGETLDGSDDHTDGGDSTATGNSDAAIDSGLKVVGSNSCDFPSSLDFYAFTDDGGMLPVGSFRLGFYIYATTGADDGGIFRKYHDADEYFYIRMDGTDDFRVEYKNVSETSQVVTSTNVLPDETWVFVEVAFDDTANTLEVFINGVSKGSDTTSIGAFTTGDGIRIGEYGGITNDIHMDQIIISNDYTRDLNALKDITAYPGS